MTLGPVRYLVIAALLLGSGTPAAGDQLCQVGLTLPQALDELREEGLAIVWSSALVSDDMVVRSQPQAASARAVLDEILAPYGLVVSEEPQGQLVVVVRKGEPFRPATGSISGQVLQSGAHHGITVRVVGAPHNVSVAADGRFRIDDLTPGYYVVEASAPGTLPTRVADVAVKAREETPLFIRLEPSDVFLNEIVVTPGHFRLLAREPEGGTFLTGAEVEQMPHVADDLFRAVKRLPGTAGGDTSAIFHIRGGENQNVLVLLDGVELYEPFHLKDFQNAFSAVDATAVSGVDFLTGGFPVEYGDRMSGVMDISTTDRGGPPTTSVSTSTINSRVTSQGGFNDDRGQWLVNARLWYPDTVATHITGTDKEIRTKFYDVLAKVQHRTGDRSTLALNVLFSYDDLGFTDVDDEILETVTARYESHQEWLTLRTDWSDTLSSQTMLTSGRVERQRLGGSHDQGRETLDVQDRRLIDFFSLKQDWRYKLGDGHAFKWGIEARREEATYDYSRHALDLAYEPPENASESVVLTPAGTSYSAYLADRVRLTPALVVEAGLRWDRQFFTAEHQISPRFNLMYEFSQSTTLRAGWGRFFQSQRLNELQVEDGVSDFYRAQLAEHVTASIEHRFAPDFGLRLELYHKRLSRLHPRFENLFSPLELFPEASSDRVEVVPDGGRADGLEILLDIGPRSGFDWWLSYSLARAEDEIEGVMVARSWDQRHAAYAAVNWAVAPGWNLNLSGAWHTGWPTTEVRAETVIGDDGAVGHELVLGPRNGERLSDYLRFDLRASRTFSTDLGEIRVFVEAVNFTNHMNVCCLDDFEAAAGDSGAVEVSHKEGYWPGIIPSLGLNWTF